MTSEQSAQAIVADFLPLYGRDYVVAVNQAEQPGSVTVLVTGLTEVGRLFADFTMRQLKLRAEGKA